MRSPAHDVEALAAALSDPRIGDFAVTRIFNRPAHEVNAAIEDLFCEKRPDDVLLLYVSCHGVKDDAGRLYFATVNTRINRLGSSAVASTFVSEQMSLSMSRNIILLLDCCYSGAFVEGMVRRGGGNVGVTERLGGSGRAILSSSSALEYAFELDERHRTKEVSLAEAGQRQSGRPSIFTGALIEGLTTGEADYNQDGCISVDELYDYAYDKVTAVNPKQTPTKFSDVSGELIVAYSPQTASPPALPEEVTAAVASPLPSVRMGVIDTLKGLALVGDEIGRLAYERLKTMLDDDSRSVAAKARESVTEIERAQPGGYRPKPDTPAPWLPPGAPPSHSSAGNPPPPAPHGAGAVPWPWPAPASPPPFIPARAPDSGRAHQIGVVPQGPPSRFREDVLQAGSLLAYFMPLFTSLLLLFSKSRNVKYDAVHCALIDGLTTVYLIVGSIVGATYSGIRYGSEEMPSSDPFVTIFLIPLFVLPWGLRGYCVVQLIRKRHAKIKFLGSLAHRMIYGRTG